MRKSILVVLLSAICICVTIFAPIKEAGTVSIPEGIRMFDSKTLYIHGYIVYRYNSSTPASGVQVFLSVWANNFWSRVDILGTAPKSLRNIYAKYNVSSEKYDEISNKDDPEAVYGATFEFNVEPYKEIKADVWMKLSISKVDASGILREDVGSISDAKAEADQKYLEEAYYWDYSNLSVQQVIQEINATISGSQNVYDIVYATINWFSINMLYMEHEDYPHQRLRASQILNETIDFPGYGKRRYGVCRHFVDAFTAIMRGFGVPTNIFYGLVFYDYGGKVGVLFAGGHAWCEVYMPNIGWIPVEVTIPDKYTRDVIRVGLVSEYYYLPIYREITNAEPKPPIDPHEYLIGSYWGWGVGEVPAGTLDGIIQAIASTPIINWILLAAIVVLVIDSLMIRRKIKALTQR